MAKRKTGARKGYQCVCDRGIGSTRSGVGERCKCKPLMGAGAADVHAKPVYMKKLIVMW